MILDWMQCPLGELFDFKNGLNAEKAAYGDGVPFVNVMDVFGNDILTAEIIRGKMQATPKQVEDYSVKRGDVLFNRTSETFDEIAMSAVYLDDLPAVFGGFVIRARPRDRRLNPHFCAYYFQSGSFRKELIRRGQGAVRANIGQKDLAVVPAIVPTLSEQRRIAEILSTWDQAIEATEKLIANSEAQKKALMQQLLTGKKRLPGFEGQPEQVELTSLVKVATGSSNKQDSLDVGSYLFFDRSTEIRRSNRYLFDMESVIVGGEGQDFVPKYFVGKFDLHQRAYAIHGFENIYGKFVYYTVYFYRHFLKRFAVGSTVPSLRMNCFSKIPVRLITMKEQVAIANLLWSSDIEINKLNKELEQLKRQKQALMQQLLTGKRRVAINEEDASA